MGVHPNLSRALACAAATAVWAMSPATIASAELHTGPTSTEDRAIGAFLSYCLPAVSAGDNAARVAEKRKLPPLPEAERDDYLQGKPGKAFELPEVGHGVVLSAHETQNCSIILQKVDAREFLEQATYWFSAEHSSFHMTVNRTLPSGEIRREYQSDTGGQKVVLQLSLKLKPVPGSPQATLTGGRASGVAADARR